MVVRRAWKFLNSYPRSPLRSPVFRASQNVCEYLCVCVHVAFACFFVFPYNKFVFVEKNPRDVEANG